MPSVAGPPQPDFLRLFRGERYRFEFGIRPTDAAWFRLAPADLPELGERRELLAGHPTRHAPWRDEAGPLLDDLLRVFPEAEAKSLAGGGAAALRKLGSLWEADFLLLSRDDAGEFRMVGGCVCDPSWWDPAEKLGRTLAEIHAPVPTLNRELGARIGIFLDRLPPGRVFTRENWGLAAVPDRNLHPALHRPRLAADAVLGQTWLRVEHQAFRALPSCGGVAFVIWLTVHSLAEVVRDLAAAAACRQMLVTMSDEIADYKGLSAARPALVAQLDRILYAQSADAPGCV